MRIILDARTVTPHFPGIGRYVASLARALPPLLAPGEELVLLEAPGVPSPFSLRQQWEIARLLRRLACGARPAIYHSPYYLMPYRPGLPTVLTVYDLIPLLYPGHVSARARLLFRVALGLALRAAGRVIAISAATRADLLAHYPITPARVTVIPLAADPAFCPRPAAEVQAVRRKYGLPGEYALYVGSDRPHKNLARLLEAWSRLRRPPALALAGPGTASHAGGPHGGKMAGRGIPVRGLGPVPEGDLPALYAGAALFVFPSEYEGFGLPVLEALACGAPVACSAIPALREVAGEAALYFGPTDPAGMAAAIGEALGDAGLRASLREAGLARAAGFSWERTARETLALYRELVHPPGQEATALAGV